MSQQQKEKELLARISDLESEIKKLKERKKYGLVWEEKPEEVVLQCQENVPIIKEVKNKRISTGDKDSDNILIEGDNYHSLSALNYTHQGKIDVIYIDPPYNTGSKDFKYNDNFVDAEDSFRHSKWLSFMSKRLELARDILKESGVIFISIDDNEFAQLKLLCDEIFNPLNFVNIIVWKKTNSPKAQANQLGNQHEFVLVYAKNIEKLSLNKFVGEVDDKYKKSFAYDDNDGRGPYQTVAIIAGGTQRSERRKSFDFHGVVEQWLYKKETLEKWWQENRIYKTKNGQYRLKKYLSETEGRMLSDIWIDGEIKALQGGSEEYIGFTTQKPLSLIKRILKLVSNKDSIVLDFFAGSGTTGHAILELNKEDGGNRRFILCTNNENNICEEVTYERLKRVMGGYKNNGGGKIEDLGGNLSYYKTDLVNIDKLHKISDEAKIKVTYQAGEMIALREDTLNEIEKNDWWQIFEGRNKMTAVYFKEDKSRLQDLVQKLRKNGKNTVLYIFSWGNNEYKNEFPDLRVEDIPEPILEVYKEINRL